MKKVSRQKQESMVFYRSFFDAISEIPDEKSRLEIYEAIFSYAFYDKKLKLSGISATLFTLIEPQLKANKMKFLNSIKGGRPSNPEPSKGSRRNLTETKTKPNGNLTETKTKPNVNVNVNDNVNVNSNKKEKEKLFKEFWEKYPVKKGRAKAEAKYPSARHVEIMQGLENYLKYWSENGTEKRFIPHPTTWLNGQRWEDVLESESPPSMESVTKAMTAGIPLYNPKDYE